MKCYENFDLNPYNSYRVSARCRRAVFLDSEEDVKNYFQSAEQPWILLGSGHNIILSKEYYEEDFVIFNGNFSIIQVDGCVITAESGAFMGDISQEALNNNLSGLEIFHDIPSSLGGAVVMNAGASGEEIKDVLIKVRYLDLDDIAIKEIRKEDISFEYRNSFFQRNRNNIILKAWLQLEHKDAIQIKSKMEAIKAARDTKQPKEFPNAGSVFKRPKGYYVGAIMDELGLKGYAIGGAKISEKHGGFIVNFNNATGQDILAIIDHIQAKVKEKYGFELEVEQRII